LIFVREASDPLTSLVKQIDRRLAAAAGKTPQSLGAYVLFVNNSDGLKQRLGAMAAKENLKHVNLCIGAPPKGYEVANEADVTAVIYTVGRRWQQQVKANFALRKGELNAEKAAAIVKALSDVLPPYVQPLVATSREKGQSWRYTFARPADGWFRPGFDDTRWKSGPGGFGTRGTPGAVVRTEWKTADIWLRRAITLPKGPFTHVSLLLHHDEDVEVYLNGVLAAKLTGWAVAYKEAPITEEARKALKPGANVLAVHCRQTFGGQYIDVGLLDLRR
jgi:hypothetical protein